MRRRVFMMILLALLTACGGDAASGGSNNNPVVSDALVLRMAYGSEKQAWITAVTDQFNQGQHTTPDGRLIQVEALAMGSGESLDGILDGSLNAAIWSPASSLYLPLGQQRWSAAHPGTELFNPATVEPLVLSPVVLAMWKPMAQALGWPDQQISWHGLADLTASGKTWADYGHPEWGPFQFGHTHPAYSNSGLATVVAMAYAAANKTQALTVADVQQPATSELLTAVEQSVIHYGSSTGFFATTMFDHGPGYLSAAVLYENLVIESYDQTLHPNLDLPIVAIYPEEGSFWSDHPFVVLESASADERAAAQVYRDFLLDVPQQQQSLTLGFRPANVDVPVAAPVDTLHGVDPSQLRVTLPVPDAATLTAILDTWSIAKKRVDAAIVVDTSGSMAQEQRLREARQALHPFIDAFADNDQLSLISFATDSFELSPLSAVSPKRTDLQTQVDGMIADQDTRLYDTIVETYALLEAQPESGIRALVVLTDGEDTASVRTLDEVLKAISGSAESGRGVKIFTIAYGSDADFDVLRQIAERTGGRAYRGDPQTIQAVYSDIATFF